MSEHNLSADPRVVDVTHPDTHYQVQCQRVLLLASELKPLKKSKKEKRASHFAFKIQISVRNQAAYSRLKVQVIAVDDEDETSPGFGLQFTLLGVFVGDAATPPQVLLDFSRLYTLSILWPYAREYTSDQLRRVGLPFDALPIINPQVVTERLIEAGLVEVEGVETQTAVEE